MCKGRAKGTDLSPNRDFCTWITDEPSNQYKSSTFVLKAIL